MIFLIRKRLLFEDDFIILIDKPAGLMVEPDRNNYPNLLEEMKKYLKSSTNDSEIYAQHIHRLDRPVSGVILFAKQRSVLKNLSEQFAERRVKKYYQACTQHAPEQRKGVLENWHRKEKKKATLAGVEFPYSEKVILNYEVRPVGHSFLWNIELHTGKFHQIRAQLANIGCPIIGDELYGSSLAYQPHAIALHASRLTFQHPVSNREMIIETSSDFGI